MFCSKCGAQVADSAAFCPSCGQATGAPAAAPRGIPLAPGGFAPPAAAYAPAAQAPPPGVAVGYAAPGAGQRVVFAGFWLRLVAYIVDALIVGIPFGIIFMSFIASSGLFNRMQSGGFTSPADMFRFLGIRMVPEIIFSAFVVDWLYYALLESSGWQATVGKKALGLYVTDLAGNRISFGRATGRYFSMVLFRIVPIAGPLLFFPIDCICAGLTEKKQALHDMMASCLVNRKI